MARERKRVDGELVAYEIAWIVQLITGEQIDPDAINPYRTGKPIKKRQRSRARINAENNAGWALMDRFMGGGHALPDKPAIVEAKG